MAKQEVVIEVDIQGTPKVESMRTQMRKLREELATLPEGTAEFDRVQRRLGELKDQMDDLGKSVNTVSGAPLERLNNSFSMIGSSILSLDFENALTGVRGMTNAMKDFKFGDLSKGAKSFGGTMFDLGKTLLMNPIFLIASVIAAIILNFEKLVNAGGLVGKVFGFIKDQIDFVIDGITDFLNWTGLIDTEASERAEAAKKRNEEMLADLQKANEAVEKLREDLLRGRMNERERELRDIQKWYDDQLWLARGNADLQNEIGEVARQKRDAINDKYDQIEEDKAKAKREKNKADAEKDKQEKERERKEEYDKAVKQQQLLDNIKREAADEEEALAQEIQNIKQGAQATELQNLQDEYFTKIELAKKYGLDFLALEQELKDKQTEVNNKYRKSEEDADKNAADKAIELEQITAEKKLQMASNAIGALITLNDSFPANTLKNAKKSFEINKKLQLAQAAINGTQSVMSVLADPTLVGPARYVAAATAAVTAIANIVKIQKTTFDSSKFTPTTPSSNGGGGGGGGMGGGSTNAPALDLSFINGQTNQPQPLQTYVLATNVSTAQEAEQKIKDQSRIIK
jgi:hypothetical protein